MKVLNTLSWIGLALILCANLSSCRKKEEGPITGNSPNYDEPLKAALMEASNGVGINYFILPESDQYSLIPQDPQNPITDAKVQLGKLLFHETGIALDPKYVEEGMSTYSCASCHFAQGGFQANRQQGIGDGGIGFGMAGEGRVPNPMYAIDSLDVQPIRTPTAMNGAYQEVMLWNGQFGATGPNEGTEDQWAMGTPIFNNNFGLQGLETQAIAGLSVHRLRVDEEVCQEISVYEGLFDVAFPDWPIETRYTLRTAGMAIAAYERTMMSNEAPWQDWLRGNTNAMSDSEKRGATLFFTKAQCGNCHTGPALNSMTFYGLGMSDLDGPGIYGNSPDNSANLGRGGFTGNPADNYKFKTPQLYNLKDSPFFGHGGNFNSVREVVEYKNEAVPENESVPAVQLSELFVPLNLTEQEITDTVARSAFIIPRL
ncbi:MAG: cytochrome c peroxidase [Bacteroidota bacterium]